MKILFKYPTFRRPDWFKETLERYYNMMSGKVDYEFLINLNNDDETMNNNTMRRYLEDMPHLQFLFGGYKTKIEAVNDGMMGRSFDILFLISDDMIPMIHDFDLVISNLMAKHFPDTDGALHLNDDCCGKDRTITLSIMGKKLYNQIGYIYHPSYKSFYCDNEFTDVVYAMKKVVYISDIIVKHDWRGWSETDGVYKKNHKLGEGDKQTYETRKALGFPK